MEHRETILVVKNEGVFTRFKERVSSNHQRLEFAANLIEARRYYKKYRPWLLVVPVDAARLMVSLLRKANKDKTMVLGLTSVDGPTTLEWANRLAPQDDIDQVAKVASFLLVEHNRQNNDPFVSREGAILAPEDLPAFEEERIDQVAATRVQSVDSLIVGDLLQEDDLGTEAETTRRHLSDAWVAQSYPTGHGQDVVEDKTAPVAGQAALISAGDAPGADEEHDRIKLDLVALHEQYILILRRVDELDKDFDELDQDREQMLVLKEQYKLVLQRVSDLDREIQHMSPPAEGDLAGEFQQALAGLGKLQGAVDTQETLVSTLSQQMADLAPRTDLEQARKDQDRTGKDLGQIRSAFKELGKELARTREDLEEQRSESRRRQEILDDQADRLEAQATRLDEIDRHADSAGSKASELRDREQVLSAAVQQAPAPASDQLEETRQQIVELQEQIEARARYFNALNRRFNRLSMDVKQEQEVRQSEQAQQLGQTNLIRDGLDQLSETLPSLVERIDDLALDKAPASRLKQAADRLEETRAELAALRGELDQQGERSRESLSTLQGEVSAQSARLEANEGRLEEISRDSASAEQLRQARQELEDASARREEARQLNRREREDRRQEARASQAEEIQRVSQTQDALAGRLEEARGELGQGLERLQGELGVARQDLEGQEQKVAGHTSGLDALKTRFEELSERASVQELRSARETMSQQLEQVRSDLDRQIAHVRQLQPEQRQMLDALAERADRARQSLDALEEQISEAARTIDALAGEQAAQAARVGEAADEQAALAGRLERTASDLTEQAAARAADAERGREDLAAALVKIAEQASQIQEDLARELTGVEERARQDREELGAAQAATARLREELARSLETQEGLAREALTTQVAEMTAAREELAEEVSRQAELVEQAHEELAEELAKASAHAKLERAELVGDQVTQAAQLEELAGELARGQRQLATVREELAARAEQDARRQAEAEAVLAAKAAEAAEARDALARSVEQAAAEGRQGREELARSAERQESAGREARAELASAGLQRAEELARTHEELAEEVSRHAEQTEQAHEEQAEELTKLGELARQAREDLARVQAEQTEQAEEAREALNLKQEGLGQQLEETRRDQAALQEDLARQAGALEHLDARVDQQERGRGDDADRLHRGEERTAALDHRLEGVQETLDQRHRDASEASEALGARLDQARDELNQGLELARRDQASFREALDVQAASLGELKERTEELALEEATAGEEVRQRFEQMRTEQSQTLHHAWEDLGQQLDQMQQRNSELEELLASQAVIVAALDGRMEKLAGEKASAADLAAARLETEQLGEDQSRKLQHVWEDLGQHLDQAQQRGIELRRSLEKLEVVVDGKASATDVEQARQDLSRAVLQAREELCAQVELISAEFEQQRVQEKQSRGAIQDAGLTLEGRAADIERRLALLAEETASATALADVRQALDRSEQARQDLSSELSVERQGLEELTAEFNDAEAARAERGQQAEERDEALDQRVDGALRRADELQKELEAQAGAFYTIDERLDELTRDRSKLGELSRAIEARAEDEAGSIAEVTAALGAARQEREEILAEADAQRGILAAIEERLDAVSKGAAGHDAHLSQQVELLRDEQSEKLQRAWDELGQQLDWVKVDLGQQEEQASNHRAGTLEKIEAQANEIAALERRLEEQAREGSQPGVVALQETTPEREASRRELEREIQEARDELARTQEELEEQADAIAAVEQRLGSASAGSAQAAALAELRTEQEEIRRQLERRLQLTQEVVDQQGNSVEESKVGILREISAQAERLAMVERRLELARQQGEQQVGGEGEAAAQVQRLLEDQLRQTREDVERQLVLTEEARAGLQGEIAAQSDKLADVEGRIEEYSRHGGGEAAGEDGAAQEGVEQAILILGQALERTRDDLELQLVRSREARGALEEEVAAHIDRLDGVERRVEGMERPPSSAATAGADEARDALEHSLGQLETRLEQTTVALEHQLAESREARGALREEIFSQSEKVAAVEKLVEALEQPSPETAGADESRAALEEEIEKLEQSLQQTKDDLEQQRAEDGAARQGLQAEVAAQADRVVAVERSLEEAAPPDDGDPRRTTGEALGKIEQARQLIELKLKRTQEYIDTQVDQAGDEREALRIEVAAHAERLGVVEREQPRSGEQATAEGEAPNGAVAQPAGAAVDEEREERRHRIERKLELMKEDLEQQFGHSERAQEALRDKILAQGEALAALGRRHGDLLEDGRQEQHPTGAVAAMQQQIEDQSRSIQQLKQQLDRSEAPAPVWEQASPRGQQGPRWGSVPHVALFVGLALSLSIGLYAVFRTSPSRQGVDAAPEAPVGGAADAGVRDDGARAAAPSSRGEAGVAPAPAKDPSPPGTKSLTPRQQKALRKRREQLVKTAKRLLRRKKHRRAQKTLMLALDIADGFRARMTLALSLEQSGDFNRAIEELSKAIPLAPKRNRAWLYDYLGVIHTKARDGKSACSAFKMALRLKPRLKSARRHRRRFCK